MTTEMYFTVIVRREEGVEYIPEEFSTLIRAQGFVSKLLESLA